MHKPAWIPDTMQNAGKLRKLPQENFTTDKEMVGLKDGRMGRP